MNIALIGHVDAGKSTLCGRILVETNKVKSDGPLAWITDTDEEERLKSKTHDINMMSFQTSRRTYTLIDTPGHRTLVPQMIDGISRADIAILIISARKGEFEAGFNGGQTTEHLMIAKTFGIKYVVIVVNKIEDVTVIDHQTERFNEIVRIFTPYISKVIGFNSDTYCYIPIDALNGTNIGKLLNKLDSLPDVPSTANLPFRFPIADKVNEPETSTVYVSGKLVSGTIKENSIAMIMPQRTACVINRIDKDGLHISRACEVHAGNVLCSTDNICRCANKAVATIINMSSKQFVTAGFSGIMHIHTERVHVTISKIKGKKPLVLPKERASAIIEFERPIAIDTFKSTPFMGRFVIRTEEETAIVGIITQLPKI